LVTVAFDHVDPIDLDDEDRELARQLFGDVDRIPDDARALLVAVCGRRSGKSYLLGALYQLWRMLFADLSCLAPGEIAYAVVVADRKKNARQCLNYVRGAIESVPALKRMVVDDNSDAITIQRKDGAKVAFEVRAAVRGGAAGRGGTLVSACIDECAFLQDEKSGAVVSAEDVYGALSPSVINGGMVVLASTPWGEEGMLYDEYARNYGHPITAIAAHAPTMLLNPSKAAEIERETIRDPDKAAREFGAQFMAAGAGVFFAPTACRAVLIPEMIRVSAIPAGHIRSGVGGDLGLVHDASAIVAIHQITDSDGKTLRTYVADILELRPTRTEPLKLSAVVQQFDKFAKEHGSRMVLVDHHVLEPAREHADPLGLGLIAAAGGQDAKIQRFVEARDLINVGGIEIPGEFRRLVNQLLNVTSKPTAGGGLQIAMPRRGGVHGDIVAAFVMAVKALTEAAPVHMARYSLARHKPVLNEFGSTVSGSRWQGMGGQGF